VTDHFDQISPLDGAHQVDADGTVSPAYPFEAPSVPPQYADTGFQESVAEQVAAQRAMLAEPAGNVDIKGAPHFLRVVDGSEVCGQCTEPFPCTAYRELADRQLVGQQTSPTGVASSLVPPTMAEAAAAAGMPIDEFMRRLRATRDV
jgi:hypothetical protein